MQLQAILEALGVNVPEDILNNPSAQADLALAKIEELHFALSRCYDANLDPQTKALVAKALEA